MTLEILQNEMIASMKNHDKPRKAVLASMVDAVKKAAIDKGCRDNVPESLVNEVLLKYKKLVQEQIDTCPAERAETLEDYKYQMSVVAEFAPVLMTSPVQIEIAVRRLILDNNIEPIKSNRGVIMKLVAANLKGKADMSVVSKVVGGVLK